VAKIIPAQEAGLGEGVGRVRVSTSRARRGKILAVEHPIFGWVHYRQWALLRLVPEDRILPSIIVGISTFAVAKLVLDHLNLVIGGAVEALFDPGAGNPILDFILKAIGIQGIATTAQAVTGIDISGKTLGDALAAITEPLPTYMALMAAGLTLAGLDPGMALRAFAELLNAITPLT